jgi:tape measure domain-containing protein
MSGAFNAASKSSNQLSLGLGGLRTLVAQAFAVGTIINFAKSVTDVVARLELMQLRLNYIYGSTTAGELAFSRLTGKIKALGLEYESTMEQAVSFSIAARQVGYTTGVAEKMFIDFSSALKAAGVSNLQAQRSFYALQQMMSKGVVSAEELNRQMGESLPGAAYLMYRAFKQLHPEQVQTFEDFRKLQKEGKILTAEVIEPFITLVRDEFAPALAGKQNSAASSLNRLTTEIVLLKDALLDTETIKGFADFFADAFSRLTYLMKAEIPTLEKVGLLLKGIYYAPGVAIFGEAATRGTGFEETIKKIRLQEAAAKGTDVSFQRMMNDLIKQTEGMSKTDLEKLIQALDQDIKSQGERLSGARKANTAEIESFLRGEPIKIGDEKGISIPLIGDPERQRKLLDLAKSFMDELQTIVSKEPTGSQDEATGKKEDPRLKALEDRIAAQKALIASEKESLILFNETAAFELSTTKNLKDLTLELLELEKKLAVLKAGGPGEKAEAIAEQEIKTTEELIKFRKQERDLLVEQIKLEAMLIEKRLAQTKQGSVDEMNVLMELMDKEVEIEIAKNNLVGDARDKVIQENLKNQKKMLSDSAKSLEEFRKKVAEAIQAPFLDETQLKRASIISEYEELIYEVKNQFDLGKISAQEFSDAVKGLNDAMQKALEDVGGDSKNLFGLSDKQLSQIKDALNIVSNAFKDLYDARMELARRANEAELEMLDKRFNAGLMRENEYNEKVAEIKKRQALAERDAAKFGIVLNTAQGIANVWSKFVSAPPVAAALTALLLGVSAAQLNAVNSAPLPTFHEGGLDIRKNSKKKPDNGLKSDEFYAKLQEGESVMTREETRKYKDVLKAIREDAMPIELMKAYKLPAYPRSIDKPSLMASNNTSLELAYQNAELVDAVKRNGAVTIRNANDIAEAIVSKSSFMKIANRRRIK